MLPESVSYTFRIDPAKARIRHGVDPSDGWTYGQVELLLEHVTAPLSYTDELRAFAPMDPSKKWSGSMEYQCAIDPTTGDAYTWHWQGRMGEPDRWREFVKDAGRTSAEDLSVY